jgi:endonuclease/exonuclease/phosphatase family metal-dependent hydrolase
MRLTTETDYPAPRRYFLGLHLVRWIGLALIAMVLIVWDGYRREPTLAAAGSSLNGSANEFKNPTFRVGTFNIDGGVGDPDQKLDLNRTADCMRGCDLIGLQEVHGRTWTDSRDQAQILGEDMKLPWLYAPAETQWWHNSFGNAVIADLPVESWQRFPVSGPASTNNRAILIVHFRLGKQILHVLVVHLPTTNDRPAQCAMVQALFYSFEKPAMLIGDLNARAGDPWIERRRTHADMVDAVGEFAEKQVPDHVDWIFARGLQCVGGGTVDRHASDHPFYWADFQVP